MHLTQNEGKFVVADRFISTLKNKICKYKTALLKNVYIDKFNGIVNEYNNRYYRTYIFIDSIKEINNNDSKFKVGDLIRISKYKNIFAKGYTPNWSEEVFIIKEIKNAVSWTYVINYLYGEGITGTFYKKNNKKKINNNLEQNNSLKEK